MQKNVTDERIVKTAEDQLQEYLAATTGLSASYEPLSGGHLPHYLRQAYALGCLKVGPQRFLGIFLRDGAELKPATFEKQLPKLWPKKREELNGYCLIAQELPSYVRKRLVERQIPYVVPGREIYWPALGTLVKNRQRRSHPGTTGERLGPAAQVTLLLGLNGLCQQPVTPKVLARRLGYTAMTMTRALNELELNKLGQVIRRGKERHLSFPTDRRTLWHKAIPLVHNPVRKVVRVTEAALLGTDVAVYRAGETALAENSMLAPPAEPVYAAASADWRTFGSSLEPMPIPEPGTCRVQVWRYPPGLLAKEKDVDPFSLWLSLHGQADERVAQALDQLIEEALT